MHKRELTTNHIDGMINTFRTNLLELVAAGGNIEAVFLSASTEERITTTQAALNPLKVIELTINTTAQRINELAEPMESEAREIFVEQMLKSIREETTDSPS